MAIAAQAELRRPGLVAGLHGVRERRRAGEVREVVRRHAAPRRDRRRPGAPHVPRRHAVPQPRRQRPRRRPRDAPVLQRGDPRGRGDRPRRRGAVADLQAVVHRSRAQLPHGGLRGGAAAAAAPPDPRRPPPPPPPPPTSRPPLTAAAPLTRSPPPRSFGVITSQDVEGPVDFKFSLVRSGGDHATVADHVIVLRCPPPPPPPPLRLHRHLHPLNPFLLPQFDFTFLHFHTMMVDEDGDPAPTSMAVSFEQADCVDNLNEGLCGVHDRRRDVRGRRHRRGLQEDVRQVRGAAVPLGLLADDSLVITETVNGLPTKFESPNTDAPLPIAPSELTGGDRARAVTLTFSRNLLVHDVVYGELGRFRSDALLLHGQNHPPLRAAAAAVPGVAAAADGRLLHPRAVRLLVGVLGDGRAPRADAVLEPVRRRRRRDGAAVDLPEGGREGRRPLRCCGADNVGLSAPRRPR